MTDKKHSGRPRAASTPDEYRTDGGTSRLQVGTELQELVTDLLEFRMDHRDDLQNDEQQRLLQAEADLRTVASALDQPGQGTTTGATDDREA